MKVTTAIAALAFATIGSSSIIRPDVQTPFTADPLKVPGDNPLYYCNDPTEYIGKIAYVNLSPNPPIPGQNLTITADGLFTETVDEGATIELSVKYNRFITLFHVTADLCENLPRINLECPLEKGQMAVHQEVSIPKAVPPGSYDVLADVKDKDGKQITCMKASVAFGKN